MFAKRSWGRGGTAGELGVRGDGGGEDGGCG